MDIYPGYDELKFINYEGCLFATDLGVNGVAVMTIMLPLRSSLIPRILLAGHLDFQSNSV